MPEVIEAIANGHEIACVEGEKDADNLWAIRIPATCSAHGAAAPNQEPKWTIKHSEQLRGANIVVLGDHDAQGYAHQDATCKTSLGIAKRVRILKLADHWPEIKEGNDVSDYLDAGHTREDLDALLEQAKDYAGKASGLGEWNAAEDVDPPPPRGWLLANIFCRTFLSSIIGSGGVGKTALRYAQALSLATGRKLTGEHVFQRCRVLIVSLEDDANELRRRIRAARLFYDIPLSEVDGWLFLAAPGAKAGKLMVTDIRGRAVPGTLSANLEATIVARKIDLVMLDPFIKTHSIEENANSAIDDVAQMLTDLATKHNIAVDAPHHIRKGQMQPGDADAGRGASAYIDAARLVYTCSPMSDDEAKAFSIPVEERWEFIRVDSGKPNIARRNRNAKWFRLVGVKLDNATELYPNGDDVQTVSPWEPPDAWQTTTSLGLNAILTDIDHGMENGQRYSNSPAAGDDRQVWPVVQKHYPDKSEAHCRIIIKNWLDTGLLYPDDYDDPVQRKKRKGLFVDDTKRPARTEII